MALAVVHAESVGRESPLDGESQGQDDDLGERHARRLAKQALSLYFPLI